MSSLTRTVDASSEPITLADAKLWCRVDNTAEDAVISAIISAARQQVESDTGRQLGSQTWVWNVDQAWRLPRMSDAVNVDLRWGDTAWSAAEWPWFLWGRRFPALRAPVTPVVRVSSITYRSGGADVAYDLANFRVGGDRDLIFQDGLPISDEQKDAITVTMTAGLATIPERYLQAMRLLIVHWYENRVPVQMGRAHSITELPLTYSPLVAGSRSWSL